MVQQVLHKNGIVGKMSYDDFRHEFLTCITESQKFLRHKNNEEASVVSLRDAARTLKIFAWFYQNCFPLERSSKSDLARRCMVLALSQVYFFRLDPKNRGNYADLMNQIRGML